MAHVDDVAPGANANANDDTQEKPPKTLPKLTFTLKRRVESGASARADVDAELDAKRARVADGERKIRELKAAMKRLTSMIPNDGRHELQIDEIEQKKEGKRAPSALARGVAPRAAIFGLTSVVDGRDGRNAEDLSPSSSAREDAEGEDVAGAMGGKERKVVSADPPRVPKEAPAAKKKLEDALNKLQKLDRTGVFHYPVTEDIAPGYFAVIARPMDFVTLRARVKNNDYPHYYQFCVDVETMYRNALQYNPPASEIHQMASRMLEQARRIMNRIRGLSPNAGFVKPKKIRNVSVNKASASIGTGGGGSTAISADIQMFDTGVDGQEFLPDEFDMGGDIQDHDEFGIDSFLHETFSMADDFDEDKLEGQKFVNAPQEMLMKPAVAAKRQTFKMPERGREFLTLSTALMEGDGRMARSTFLPSGNSAPLDYYQASVKSFASVLTTQALKVLSGPAKAWFERAALPEPVMVPVPDLSVPLTPPTSAPTSLPTSKSAAPESLQKPPLQPSNHPNVTWLYDAPSLTEILARGNPNDPSHPARVKAGIAAFRAMQRAREVITGDRDPADENPLDRLPSGFIPHGTTMVFAITVLGNTIAQTLRRRGIVISGPNPPPSTKPTDDSGPPIDDRDDIPLSKLV